MASESLRQPVGSLLTVDVGNTHTVIGLFIEDRLDGTWRIRTEKGVTQDEIATIVHQFLNIHQIGLNEIEDLIISCVVPAVLTGWRNFCANFLGRKALIVLENIDPGIPIDYHRVGADRICNSIAAFKRYGKALIVIDYGTATTFDCVSDMGRFLGGSIAPGLKTAAEALNLRTSMLPLTDLSSPPESALAHDSLSALKAGFIYGFAGLTEGIVARLKSCLNQDPVVIATGGLAPLIAPYCPVIENVLPELTLEGLKIIYQHHREKP